MEDAYIEHDNPLSDYFFLRRNGKNYSAIRIAWVHILKKIFEYCFQNKLYYKSTEEAITIFFLQKNEEHVCRLIHELYLLSTMINYEKDFKLNNDEIESIHHKIQIVLKEFETYDGTK